MVSRINQRGASQRRRVNFEGLGAGCFSNPCCKQGMFEEAPLLPNKLCSAVLCKQPFA